MSVSLLNKAQQTQRALSGASERSSDEHQKLATLLAQLRKQCEHRNAGELVGSYRTPSVRLCLSCGIEEETEYGSFEVLTVAPDLVYRGRTQFLAARPFPDHAERWTMCRSRHHVPASKLVKNTGYCTQHVGDLCPTCEGRCRWHDPAGDGHGGLNGGRWNTCTTCNGTGRKP